MMMRLLAGLTLLAILNACAPVTRMKDGSYSQLQPENTALRESLAVRPPATALTITYRVVRECIYRDSSVLLVGRNADTDAILKMRAIRDRIQILYTRAGQATDTALIYSNGRLSDFNIGDTVTGRRGTPEAEPFEKALAVQRVKAANPRAPGVHVLNDFSLLTPAYITTAFRVGAEVARVEDESGTLWARYIFAGVSTYKGVNAAVLDLRRDVPDGREYGPVLVGFNIIDLNNGLPLLYVLNSGSNIRIEQKECRR